jgi:hypothetical protein
MRRRRFLRLISPNRSAPRDARLAQFHDERGIVGAVPLARIDERESGSSTERRHAEAGYHAARHPQGKNVLIDERYSCA